MTAIMLVLSALAIVGHLLFQLWKTYFAPKDDKLELANQKIGAIESQLFDLKVEKEQLKIDLEKKASEFAKLQHQKISADVKLGQRYENIAPFMEEFPYKQDEIRGLFNPIDLIVFREDEVVLVEIKTGEAQLSEKQRRIRDNVKAGRVRFEVHRMSEKGMSIK